MSNIKYRKLYFLCMVLEILLLIMISGWYYFSERKMGMIRHILFRNVHKFPKYYRCKCKIDSRFYGCLFDYSISIVYSF